MSYARRRCPHCKTTFTPESRYQRTCNRTCGLQAGNKRMRQERKAAGKPTLWQFASQQKAQQAAKVPSSSWWADGGDFYQRAHSEAERMLSQAPSPTPRTLEREW